MCSGIFPSILNKLLKPTPCVLCFFNQTKTLRTGLVLGKLWADKVEHWGHTFPDLGCPSSLYICKPSVLPIQLINLSLLAFPPIWYLPLKFLCFRFPLARLGSRLPPRGRAPVAVAAVSLLCRRRPSLQTGRPLPLARLPPRGRTSTAALLSSRRGLFPSRAL